MLALICILSLCLAALVVLVTSRPSDSNRLPPTPAGLPLAGNAFQLPSRFLFRKLCEWQGKLGDIYMVSAFGQRIVVLGSAAVAADILDRMAVVTSGRPSYTMSTLMTRDMDFAIAPYGERWRSHRRVAHENLNSRAVGAYLSVQEKGAADLIQTLARPHSDLHHVLNLFSGTTVWRALYGETSSHMEDRIKGMTHAVELVLNVMSPTASLANLFPVLLRLPAAINPWKSHGDKTFREIDFGISCVREGSSVQNDATFVASCMKAKERNANLTEADIAWITMNLFGAGVETTAYTLHFFILAMLLYPDEAKKAQQMVDSVVGNRLPTFENRDELAYVDAIIREILRWRPVAPLAIPHLATEDFTYGEYTIPKGTFIMANVWHINHNPDAFPAPDVFLPERYLDSSGKLKTLDTDYHDGVLAFGYGRRICPGRTFATNELFITIAYLLWSFDFCKAVDEQGKEITPSSTDLVDENILIYPAPFRYVLKPRRDLVAAFDSPS